MKAYAGVTTTLKAQWSRRLRCATARLFRSAATCRRRLRGAGHQFDNVVVVVGYGSAVRHADDGAVGQLLDQDLVQAGLGGRVERAGCFIEKHEVGPLQQHPGEGDALLFTAGQQLLPVVAGFQRRDPVAQAAGVQHAPAGGVVELIGRQRVAHGGLESAARQVAALRQKHDAGLGRQRDGAGAMQP